MDARAYRDHRDVEALQHFMAEVWAATDGCGCLHPGDIPHHLFSGNKLFDPSEVCTIWEDGSGIAGFLITSSRYRCYDLHIRPDLRRVDLEHDLVAHADAELSRLMDLHGVEADRVVADADRDDPIRAKALAANGWVRSDEPPWRVNRIALTDLPEPVVPDGYTIRQVESYSEAKPLAAVHGASFGSAWDEAMYRTLMESPGYSMDREWVVVAPDGEYAAFTETWRDSINRTGLFEPVGTHPDHRRRGLGKAMLITVLHAMADEGMDYGIVVSSGLNTGSNALYRSAGFSPWRFVDQWMKPVGEGGIQAAVRGDRGVASAG